MRPLPPSAMRGVAAMSAAAIALALPVVAKWEGRRLDPYLDLAGILTVCDGDTYRVEQRLHSSAECDARLRVAMQRHADIIRPCVPASTPVEAQAAFLSLAYNIGGAKFCGSTLARKLKAGDLAGACAEISRWTRVGAATVRGLANRRAEERKLCERGLV